MIAKEQTEKLLPSTSPLAKEQTYGERMYDAVFNQGINFWINLTASAAFSFWVAHSQNKIKLPFTKGEGIVPRDIQVKLGNWIEKQFFMQTMKNPTTRMERSQSMSGTLTLLTPGHFILLPSVWLGPKIKAPFVKFFNRMHYGDEAMEDPTLQQRHQLIAEEARPTFAGAVVGRAGSVLATQIFARTIGTPDNWLNIVGRKLNIGWMQKFGGMDPMAETIGETVGNDIQRLAPKFTENVNEQFADKNYNWSYKQMGDPNLNTSGRYNQSLQNFGRYVGQDVLYSVITSVTVHPIINTLKNFIPGLTYKPKVARPAEMAAPPPMKKIRSNPIADAVPEAPHEAQGSDRPSTHVSGITTADRLVHASGMQVTS